jgi:hypothetical protein
MPVLSVLHFPFYSKPLEPMTLRRAHRPSRRPMVGWRSRRELVAPYAPLVCRHALVNTPVGSLSRIVRGTAYSTRFPARQRRRPSPLRNRVGAHIGRFEACSTFTRVTACRLAAPPCGTFVSRAPTVSLVFGGQTRECAVKSRGYSVGAISTRQTGSLQPVAIGERRLRRSSFPSTITDVVSEPSFHAHCLGHQSIVFCVRASQIRILYRSLPTCCFVIRFGLHVSSVTDGSYVR